MIYVFGPKDKPPKDLLVINTTSTSNDFGCALSPFLLGPVDLYDGLVSQTVENGWQYSKVYAKHIDSSGEPTKEYWEWAEEGWRNTRAVRYPMGKGAVPVYFLWGGKSPYTQMRKLSYVEARRQIYAKLYRPCAAKTPAFAKLKELAAQGDLGLWDFDGCNHHALGLTIDQVIDDPKRKAGHAFHLAQMLGEK